MPSRDARGRGRLSRNCDAASPRRDADERARVYRRPQRARRVSATCVAAPGRRSEEVGLTMPADAAATVLVATDYDPLMRLLVRVLDDAGYAVDPVADGHELLRRLRASVRPCVALLSLHRARPNSRAVLAAVAAEEALARGHGYILLTALWDALPHDLAALLQGLGGAIVPKPFDLGLLLDAVAKVAGRLAGG